MPLIIDGYEVDVEVSSELRFENEVTEHPVESGSDVADNARARPVTLDVEGLVSNTPIGALATRRQKGALSVEEVTFTDVNGVPVALPADEARARLLAIRNAREPVRVECSQGVYDDMVMQTFSPRGSTEDGLRFGATFVQVTLVTNERTTVQVESRAKRVNLGSRPAIETPDAPPPSATAAAAAADVPESLRP